MKNLLFSFTLAFMGLFLIQSCNSQKYVLKDVPADKLEKIYTIKKNEILTIEIASNPTTGFTWQIANKIKPNIIEEFSKEFIKKENTEMVGAGGYDNFKFIPQKAGEVFLHFKYSREDGTFDKEKFFKVIVTE